MSLLSFLSISRVVAVMVVVVVERVFVLWCRRSSE